MPQTQTDLFNEPHIQIEGNPTLEKACNRLLLMHQNNPQLFDGDSMGEIDRRLYAEILWEDGVQTLLPADKKDAFIKTVARTQESDVYTRARRELLAKDLIRVSAKAVQDAERHRARIAGAMR